MPKTLLVIVALLPALALAQPIGVATIVEGEATVVRGSDRFALAEGVRIEPGDLVESAAPAQFVRLELDDGTAIDLGPATRMMVGPRFHRERRERPGTAYVLQGWLKLSLPEKPPQAGAGLASPAVDVAVASGIVVAHLGAGLASIFQEAGASAVTDNARGAAPRPLKAGHSLSLDNGKATMLPRVAPALLAGMPLPFRDTLPRRAARFAGVSKPPKPLPAPDYEDLAPWLQAERGLRLALMPRWRGMDRQPAFRSALIKNLRAHPEWRPILFPPPPPPPPSAPARWTAPPPAPR